MYLVDVSNGGACGRPVVPWHHKSGEKTLIAISKSGTNEPARIPWANRPRHSAKRKFRRGKRKDERQTRPDNNYAPSRMWFTRRSVPLAMLMASRPYQYGQIDLSHLKVSSAVHEIQFTVYSKKKKGLHGFQSEWSAIGLSSLLRLITAAGESTSLPLTFQQLG